MFHDWRSFCRTRSILVQGKKLRRIDSAREPGRGNSGRGAVRGTYGPLQAQVFRRLPHRNGLACIGGRDWRSKDRRPELRRSRAANESKILVLRSGAPFFRPPTRPPCNCPIGTALRWVHATTRPGTTLSDSERVATSKPWPVGDSNIWCPELPPH
jgi:hypothetical protein